MQLVPSLVGYGWTKEDEEDDELQPVLMTKESARMVIAELISCQCKAKASMCKTGRFKCSRNGMKCKPACICEGQTETCQNPNHEDDEKDWTSKSETVSDTEEDDIRIRVAVCKAVFGIIVSSIFLKDFLNTSLLKSLSLKSFCQRLIKSWARQLL